MNEALLKDILLKYEIEELFAAYSAAIDEGRYDDWVELFTDECFYSLMPRENYDSGLELSLMRCENKVGLKDRIFTVKETLFYGPRHLRHFVSGMRITGQQDGLVSVQSNYVVLQTEIDKDTRILNAGTYKDKLARVDGKLFFRERWAIYDTLMIPNSIPIPL
jgi:3-phenylpropionate/cinnamic acid dioxygenase small subunit